jgi:cob(I)alamin adenosyltransferase
MKGLVHIYTGNGKGKTSAAIGLGIRACGSGLKVLMVQFLKSADTGELKSLGKLAPEFEIFRTEEIKGFIWNMNEEQKEIAGRVIHKTFKSAVESAMRGQCDVLIMDEIMASISNGFLNKNDVSSFIKNKPEWLEVVMTGRNAPDELIELADYVSDINEIKHPFSKGINARKGIEY